MASPLPPLGAQQGSSPYPFPLSFPSPFANPATGANLGPSPVPNALGQLGNTAPSPFSQLLSTGLTPNFTNFTSAPAPAAPYGNGLINTFAPAGSNAGAGSKNRIGEDNLDDVVRGLEESERMIARAQEVLSEIQRLESGLFGGGERTEGMQIGLGGVPKLEGETSGTVSLVGRMLTTLSLAFTVLHLEYSQLLSSLSALATSHLFGALPVPLSAAKPSTAPDPTVPSPLGQTDKSTLPTISDLGSWAEKQAALEFNRKEAVKAGSKAVVDILRGNQGR